MLHKECFPSFYFSFYKQTSLIKGEKIFYLVFIEMQMYGPNVKFFLKRFLYVIILIQI